MGLKRTTAVHVWWPLIAWPVMTRLLTSSDGRHPFCF